MAFLLTGIVAHWAGLAVGVAMGYQAWQSVPDPPEEAFSDGGPLVGALFFGWLPAGISCDVVFVVARLVRRLRSPGTADASAC